MTLAGMHVFVTGGAQGIGAAIVKDTAQSEAKVTFGDIQDAQGESYAAILRSEGLEVYYVHCDAGVLESVEKAHEIAVSRYEIVQGLVNNAGVSSNVDPVKMTSEKWDRFFAVDLKSVWHTARCVLTAMRAEKKGFYRKYRLYSCQNDFPKILSLCWS